MSKKRVAALGASATSAALVGSALFAPMAIAQDDGPTSPSAYAVSANGLLDSKISYVHGTDSTELLDVSIPEENPLLQAQVAPSASKPGHAESEILQAKLGPLTIEGVTATCDQGDLSSSLAKITLNGKSYPIATQENTQVIPDPLSDVLAINLNQQVSNDDGSSTVTAVSVEILGGAAEAAGNAPVLGDLAGQTITLASATCAPQDNGGDDGDDGGDDGDDGGDDGDNGGDDGDNGDNGGDNGDNGDNGGNDEANEDGTAPAPAPQPDHIAVTG